MPSFASRPPPHCTHYNTIIVECIYYLGTLQALSGPYKHLNVLLLELLYLQIYKFDTGERPLLP